MEAPDISGISEGIKESIRADIEEKLTEEPVNPACTVGISISNSLDLNSLGFTNLHIQDAMVEIARYLLVNNCNLVYGGDLRTGGFTYIFSELAKQYSTPKNYDLFRVVNYFAWPIHLKLTRSDDSEFKANNIQLIKLIPPPGVTVEASKYISPDELQNKIIWAKSLSYMRKEIIKNTQARVLIGGQVSNYMGIMPGLLEEFITSIRAKQPVFLCGAFGGVTKGIIETLLNEEPEALTEKYQLHNLSYQELFNRWNNDETDKINYSIISQEIKDFGLISLSKANGLSENENIRLFETPHIPEMTFLILKGLKNVGLLN
jgi:hypothetical protein